MTWEKKCSLKALASFPCHAEPLERILDKFTYRQISKIVNNGKQSAILEYRFASRQMAPYHARRG